ncbi:GNAT family N-acetyltransferase [Aquimarina sp. 2304DJ70-9]|uniref:GNAT family N-acetyltransferase n=1 Tax=Aquimarina penaris TaxID=3231044 RepID=UPI003462759E
MKNNNPIVRDALPEEFLEVGELMVKVYSQLKGFPSKDEQPSYYEMLADVGSLTKKPLTRLLVALSEDGKIAGAVVYFGDMKHYGSGGTATKERNASGFRLLAVDPVARGKGIGRILTEACLQIAKDEKQNQMIIHSTKAMQVAWKMYENMGFKRSKDLDFVQGALLVFGFRLLFKKVN